MSGRKKEIRDLLIEGKSHHDPDIRFMAIRELDSRFSSMEVIEKSMQSPVLDALMIMLKDQSSDVQTNAVKLLGSVVRKLDSGKVEELVGSVVKALVDGKGAGKTKSWQMISEEQRRLQREQFQTAIKKCVKELPENEGKESGVTIVKNLIRALENRDVDLQLIAMDLLNDVLSRFGRDIQQEHKSLLPRLREKLKPHEVEDVPLRAASTLGTLSRHVADDQFKDLMEFIIKQIKETEENVTFINALGIISKEVGHRVGDYMDSVMPLLQKNCSTEQMNQEWNEDDEKENAIKIQRWEACLVAFESFLRGCKDKMGKYKYDLSKLFMRALKFDPNAVDDGGEDVAPMDQEGDGEDWGDTGGDADGWGDDGEDGGGWGGGDVGLVDESDVSWRIRSQAASCISAFVSQLSGTMKQDFKPEGSAEEAEMRYCNAFTEALTEKARLEERDQTVRIKILRAIKEMADKSILFVEEKATSFGPGNCPPMVRHRSWKPSLGDSDSPASICDKILLLFDKDQGDTVKVALFDLLRSLRVAAEEKSEVNFPYGKAIGPVYDGICSSNSDVQAMALDFLKTLAKFSRSPDEFEHKIDDIVKQIRECASESKDRIKEKALNAAAQLAGCIDSSKMSTCKMLFSAIFSALKLRDVDDDVKIAALRAMALVFAKLSSSLKGCEKDVLPILMERLNNTSTRLSAIETLESFAKQDTVALKSHIREIIDTLLKFMRTQTSKSVKHGSVATLIEVVKRYGEDLGGYSQKLFKEASTHISSSDTFLCSLILDLTGVIAESPAKSTLSKAEINEAIEKMLTFSRSPLVDSQALKALVTCFKKMSIGVSDFPTLLKRLQSLVDSKLPSFNVSVVAQCVAAMAVGADAKTRDAYIKTAVDDVRSNVTHKQQFALLSIGDIGKSTDLSSHAGLDELLLSSFNSENMALKSSASYALGSLCAGNLKKYLPALLKKLESVSDHTYLLLRAIREVVTCYYGRGDEIKAYTEDIFEGLVKHTDSKEDGVRAEVAECLGGLARIEPEKTIRFLEKSIAAKAAYTRAVAVAAFRYALDQKTREHITPVRLEIFLSTLKDKDIEVRKQAVLTFQDILVNSQLMNLKKNSVLLKDVVLPVLYKETEPNEKYLRIIDTGRGKIREDGHLPLRRAAFDALTSLMRECPHRIEEDMKNFYGATMQGCLDPEADIVVKTWEMYLMISQMPEQRKTLLNLGSGRSPTKNKGFAAVLKDFIMSKIRALREGEEKKDQRKLDDTREIIKKSLMTVFTMLRIPGIEHCSDFVNLVGRIKLTKKIAKEIKEVEKVLHSAASF